MSMLLLLDPEARIHQGLSQEFQGDNSIAAIHLAVSPQECLEKVEKQDYRFAVLNLSHLEIEELARLIHKLSAASPETKILVVGEGFTTEDLVSLIEGGADAYIRGRGTAGEIAQVLRHLRNGTFPLCPDIAASVMDRIAQLAGYRLPIADSENGQLTRRQQEVLYLLREGRTNAEIAEDLYIEIGTVKNHVHNLLQKLDAEDRYEAAAKADTVIAG